MAEIIGALGVPHGPNFPLLKREDGDEAEEVLTSYSHLRNSLEEMQPDLLVVLTCDHVTQFFAESVPIFSIGVGERAAGPCDYAEMPQHDFALAPNLARELQAGAVRSSFDVGMSQEIAFDHSITVPLHFLTPSQDLPVLPIYVNGFLPPLPLATRCYALGENLRHSLEASSEGGRVVVVASGHISSEIGGPRFYLPDPDWLAEVERRLRAGDTDDLVARATPEQLTSAGNVAGEFLTWLVMLGILGGGTPRSLELPPGRGIAFGTWAR